MTEASPEPLALTGERTVPGVARETYWFARHEAAYLWAAAALDLRGAAVVEAGSGEGYGAGLLLAAGARRVLALEYDAPAVAHTARRYHGVDAVRANLAALPLRPGAADAVVCLQVIEHLWDLPGFLRGCAQALRPGGTLVVSTPNRLTFSPGLPRGSKPINPFHVEEFDAEQLAGLVGAAGFEHVEVHGLAPGPRLLADEAAHGPLVEAQVRAVLDGSWDNTLTARVAAVAAADFVVGPADDGCLDLIATAVRP